MLCWVETVVAVEDVGLWYDGCGGGGAEGGGGGD